MKLKSQNFLISISHRENHSWQGTIQWLETGKKLHFRSELELLKLMNDVVEQASVVGSDINDTREDNENKRFRDWNDAPLIQLARSNEK